VTWDYDAEKDSVRRLDDYEVVGRMYVAHQQAPTLKVIGSRQVSRIRGGAVRIALVR